MKFKKSAVATHLLLGLALMSNQTFAGIGSKRTPSGGGGTSSGSSSSGPSGGVVIKPGTPAESKKTELKGGAAGVSCNKDQNSSKYFPLDFFQHITREGTPLKFELRSDNKVLVKIPASVDVCGKFVPLIHQDSETKNITIMMKLDNDKTYSEYIKCMEDSKVIVDNKVDHDNIEGKNYSEYSYVMDYEFDKKTDIKKTVKLSYGYPVAFDGKEGYGSTFGIDEKVSLPGDLCMKAEKVDTEFAYVNKGQDVLIEELNAICKNNNAEEIAKARKSLGNAEALKDLAEKIKAELDIAYLNAIKNDVARINKEMGEIEEKINKDKKMDEATAKKQISRYAELSKELDSKFLNPAIYRLDNLMQERAKTTDEASLKKIDDEVKKINEEVSGFSKRPATNFSNLYSMMEKYAITDQAKIIEDIRLKSFFYGKVYAGTEDPKRGKPLSLEGANQQQFERLQKFDRTLTDWSDQYLVGQGNQFPIKKTEKERQSVIERMNSRWATYEKNEYSNYNNYCSAGMTGGMKNPIKCQDWMKGQNQRRNTELKRREKDLYYIKGRNDKLEKMGMNWNEYQRKVASKEETEADTYDPYASSYTSYENNFDEIYPQYSGPSTSTAYNPYMYNMGYQQPQMMQGQQQQYSPYMMNGASTPVQQGQFQMPQMQQGGQQMGWAGI
jgi:hypothetical protein